MQTSTTDIQPGTPQTGAELHLKVAALLMPVSLAWVWFGDPITQDGPAHLAAAKIANECLAGLPNVSGVYQLAFQPLPNWGGQALGMLLLCIFNPGTTHLMLNLAGLWLPALGLASLMKSLGADRSKSWVMALWVSLMALNVLWTFGFTSFLLGIGIGWWLVGRAWKFGEGGGFIRWINLAIFWNLLFLCHLVAYALAGIVCGCLVVATPGWKMRRRAGVAASILTSLPLLVNYRRITGGSKMELIWEHLDWSRFFSISNWARQIGWVDPVSLASRKWLPVIEMESSLAILFQPIFWIMLAFICFCNSGMGRCCLKPIFIGPQRGFILAFAVLMIIGLVGPDSLGKEQGHYLPQRVMLAAMSVSTCCWPQLTGEKRKLFTSCIFIAFLLQSLLAIEFGRKSSLYAQGLRESFTMIQQGSRLVAINDAGPWSYRANPRLHADALAVMAARDVVSFNLYEAAYGYFPLQFRSQVPGLEPRRLEEISILRGASQSEKRTELVASAIQAAETNADQIMVLAQDGSELRQAVEQVMLQKRYWQIRARHCWYDLYLPEFENR